jgi:hypothetical protein
VRSGSKNRSGAVITSAVSSSDNKSVNSAQGSPMGGDGPLKSVSSSKSLLSHTGNNHQHGHHHPHHIRPAPSGLGFEGATSDMISAPPTPHTVRGDNDGDDGDDDDDGDSQSGSEEEDHFEGASVGGHSGEVDGVEIGMWSTVFGQSSNGKVALSQLPESTEYVKAQAERASKLGLPSVISYKEFLDALRPDASLIKELEKDVRDQVKKNK